MNKNHRHFDAILFDMDGVIIETKEQVENFWFEKMELHGISVDEHYLETKVHGRPAWVIIKELFPGLTEEEQKEMDRECTAFDSSQSAYALVPGIKELLIKLLFHKITLGLVTSALPPKVEVMLDSLSISSPFQTIITAKIVKNGKPDPECYLMGAENLGVPIESTLLFEDSVSGVLAAAQAGATVIGVNEPDIAPALINAGAIFTIRNFHEVEFDRITSALQFSEKGVQFILKSP